MFSLNKEDYIIIGPCEHDECSKTTAGLTFQIETNNEVVTIPTSQIRSLIGDLVELFAHLNLNKK